MYYSIAHGVRSSGLKHISIRRNRISPLGSVALAIMIRDYPVSTDHLETSSVYSPTSTSTSLPTASSPSQPIESGNSITARQTSGLLINLPAEGSVINAKTAEELSAAAIAAEKEREAWKNSEARNKLMKQIDELPRTGSLLTLDVKGNDIRVSYSHMLPII